MNSFDVGDTVYYLKLCSETNNLEVLSGKINRIVSECDKTRVFISKKKTWLDVGYWDQILQENAYKTKEECILATIDKLKGMLDE